jgi:hypothetical protein
LPSKKQAFSKATDAGSPWGGRLLLKALIGLVTLETLAAEFWGELIPETWIE